MEKKILIIDDDEDLCEELTGILNTSGYNAMYALDGVKGREMVERDGFQVVILDLKLPYLSGFEILKILKKSFFNLKVLIFSGRPMAQERLWQEMTEPVQEEEEILKTADAVVSKPINVEALLSVLEELTA